MCRVIYVPATSPVKPSGNCNVNNTKNKTRNKNRYKEKTDAGKWLKKYTSKYYCRYSPLSTKTAIMIIVFVL